MVCNFILISSDFLHNWHTYDLILVIINQHVSLCEIPKLWFVLILWFLQKTHVFSNVLGFFFEGQVLKYFDFI